MAATFERNKKNEKTKHPVLLEEAGHWHGWQIGGGIAVFIVVALLFIFVVRFAMKRNFTEAVKPHQQLATALFGGGDTLSTVSSAAPSVLTHLSQL